MGGRSQDAYHSIARTTGNWMQAARSKGSEPLSQVARLVRRHDRDRFLAALFAPARARESLHALHGFNYEVAKIREVVREPLLGRMRLQWWRDGIAAIYAGDSVRQHEVLAPLAQAIAAHRLSRVHFDRIIDAREADLDDAPPATLDALEAYAEDTAGPLVLLALEILEVRDGAAAAAGQDAGAAYALAGLLHAVPFHARARRLYLPAALIAAQGLDVERSLFALKPAPALAAIVETVAGRARARLAAARASRRAVPREALPALLPALIAERGLKRLAAVGYDPFDAALGRPDGGLSLRLAWAAWRGRY